MLHTIKHVLYMNDYKLKLFFDDGKVKIVDFEERLRNAKNMFFPLKDIDYFKQVESDGTTIVWPNGLDLCPDALYEKGVECVKKKRSNALAKTSSSRTKRQSKTTAC